MLSRVRGVSLLVLLVGAASAHVSSGATVRGLSPDVSRGATALPSVLPPTPIGTMRWSRSRRAPAPAAFAGGRGVLGVVGGINGATLARSLGLRVVEWLPALRTVQVSGSAARLSAVARRHDARVRYLEPLVTGTVAHVRNDPLTWMLDPATSAPWEWQFHAVGLDDALSLASGDPSILVGVVDSGITAVPDLHGKVAETFWDTTLHSSAADVLGHGTFVSSIIASRNDDGFGLAGFCGACRLAVYKAVPVNDVQVAEGIRTLTDAHVRVINLSIVLASPSQVVADAIAYATAAGVLLVAASGNDGTSTGSYPASLLQPLGGGAAAGLAVGASDDGGRSASFSNFGQQLSLLAPGTFDAGCSRGILGALPPVATDFEANGACAVVPIRVSGGRYAYAGGTSFAAPEVAGVAALVWSVKPSLSSTQVAAILEQTATRPAGAGWTPARGWGILDARAAVENVTGKTVADSIELSRLRVSRPRRPTSRVAAIVGAAWSDGEAAGPRTAAACHITVGAAGVRATATLAHGFARCAFTIPRRSAGEEVRGSIAVAAAGGATATATFRFLVPG